MRRNQIGDIALREGRRGAQDQFGVAHGFGNVSGDKREPRIVLAARVLHRDPRSLCSMLGDRRRVAPPQSNLVAPQRAIAGRCERTIAAAEYRDPHSVSPSAAISP